MVHKSEILYRKNHLLCEAFTDVECITGFPEYVTLLGGNFTVKGSGNIQENPLVEDNVNINKNKNQFNKKNCASKILTDQVDLSGCCLKENNLLELVFNYFCIEIEFKDASNNIVKQIDSELNTLLSLNNKVLKSKLNDIFSYVKILLPKYCFSDLKESEKIVDLRYCFQLKSLTESNTYSLYLISSKEYNLFLQAFINNEFYSSDSSLMVREFYSCLSNTENLPILNKSSTFLSLPEMKLSLLPFQKKTVEWCLFREGKVINQDTEIAHFNQLKDIDMTYAPNSFPLWRKITMCKKSIYINQVEGIFCSSLLDIQKHWLKSVKSGATGLVAEEMGLGKTIEMLTVIHMNPRPTLKPTLSFKSFRKETDEIYPIKGTLIISPSSIIHQWKNEISRFFPFLKVMIYDDAIRMIKKKRKRENLQMNSVRKNQYNKKIDFDFPNDDYNDNILKSSDNNTIVDEGVTLDEIKNYDIILTSYNAISSEIHYKNSSNNRSFRNKKKYTHIKSIMFRVQFWRILLDEVQMVDSGITNAAKVAQNIERIHSWAVSGTPIKKSIGDIYGIFCFLRLHPFANNKSLWNSLLKKFPQSLLCICREMSIRNMKFMIENELKLPKQHRICLFLPFTPVEQHNYNMLFSQCMEECQLNENEIDNLPRYTKNEKLEQAMRFWLATLRQTCSHAAIDSHFKKWYNMKTGTLKKKSLGTLNLPSLSNSPVRTILDVANAMYSQSEAMFYSSLRNYYILIIQRGQVLLQSNQNDKEGLKYCLEVFYTALNPVSDLLANLLQEAEKEESHCKEETKTEESFLEMNTNKSENHILNLKVRIRSFLGIKHRCQFFIASAYFKLGEKEKEEEYYDAAQITRRKMLKDSTAECNLMFGELREKINSEIEEKSFAVIPDAAISDKLFSGLESSSFLSAFNELALELNAQASVLDDFREKLIELLLSPLVDQSTEISEQDYQNSLEVQDEAACYQDILMLMISDRESSINGSYTSLNRVESDRLVSLNDEKTSVLLKKLHKIRKEVSPSKSNNIKKLLSELRSKINDLRASYYYIQDKNSETIKKNRVTMECNMLDKIYIEINKSYNSQSQAISKLKAENSFLNSVFNKRLTYYRQLQNISDELTDYCSEIDINEFISISLKNEAALKLKISKEKARLSYLKNLRDSTISDIPEQERICAICQTLIQKGVLTSCGHKFCGECLNEWWKAHKRCPICRTSLLKKDFFDIVFSKQEIKSIDEDALQFNNIENNKMSKSLRKFYSEINSNTFFQIQEMPIDKSYGSKIDSIIRQIKWIRINDSQAQVVIFSQWTGFLSILELALKAHNISFSNSDKGAQQFISDTSMVCFLLCSISHSAGLTLVNATHIIICEPLLQPAIELQAISRIHRIGQTRETTVWMYSIQNTIEKNILEISIRKRLNFIPRKDKDLLFVSEQILDESTSKYLSSTVNCSKYIGEAVNNDDLWESLFGKKKAD